MIFKYTYWNKYSQLFHFEEIEAKSFIVAVGEINYKLSKQFSSEGDYEIFSVEKIGE